MTPEVLQYFLRKWQRSIDAVLYSIYEKLTNAGYYVTDPQEDIDLDYYPERMRWVIFASLPDRPEDFDHLDMEVALVIVEHDPEHDFFTPLITLTNDDGSIHDNIELSDPIRINDERSWMEVWDKEKKIADDTLRFVERYNPKPTKRIWHIKGTVPGNVDFHPSMHTNVDVAKSEITERLQRILDQVARLIWNLEVKNEYSGPPATDIMMARTDLKNGKPFEALRKYHQFLSYLNDPLLELINRTAGTLDVKRAGGYAGEDWPE